jgi:hypothetical protein
MSRFHNSVQRIFIKMVNCILLFEIYGLWDDILREKWLESCHFQVFLGRNFHVVTWLYSKLTVFNLDVTVLKRLRIFFFFYFQVDIHSFKRFLLMFIFDKCLLTHLSVSNHLPYVLLLLTFFFNSSLNT